MEKPYSKIEWEMLNYKNKSAMFCINESQLRQAKRYGFNADELVKDNHMTNIKNLCVLCKFFNEYQGALDFEKLKKVFGYDSYDPKMLLDYSTKTRLMFNFIPKFNKQSDFARFFLHDNNCPMIYKKNYLESMIFGSDVGLIDRKSFNHIINRHGEEDDTRGGRVLSHNKPDSQFLFGEITSQKDQFEILSNYARSVIAYDGNVDGISNIDKVMQWYEEMIELDEIERKSNKGYIDDYGNDINYEFNFSKRTLALTAPIADFERANENGDVGIGYDLYFNEKVTNNVTMFLMWDKRTSTGFRITSIFPDIINEIEEQEPENLPREEMEDSTNPRYTGNKISLEEVQYMANKRIEKLKEKVSDPRKLDRIIKQYSDVSYLNSPLYTAFNNLYTKYSNKAHFSVNYFSQDTLLILSSDVKTNKDYQMFLNVDKNGKIRYTVKEDNYVCDIKDLPFVQKQFLNNCINEVKSCFERKTYENVL